VVFLNRQNAKPNTASINAQNYVLIVAASRTGWLKLARPQFRFGRKCTAVRMQIRKLRNGISYNFVELTGRRLIDRRVYSTANGNRLVGRLLICDRDVMVPPILSLTVFGLWSTYSLYLRFLRCFIFQTKLMATRQ